MTNDMEKLFEEMNYLRDRDRLLTALKQAGVDNWEGMDYAMEIYQEMKDD